MSTDLFDEKNTSPVIDPNKDYSAELIGEGKKFKDVAALARGKVESDEFIKSLQSELSGLRQELQARGQLSEMIDKLHKPAEPAPAPLEQRDPLPKEVNLDELFEKKFAERKAIERREANVRETQGKLIEAFGNGYVDVLKAKAAELGMAPTQLNGLAAENPKALLRLVGAEGTVHQRTNDLFAPPPPSQLQGFKPSTTDRNKAYYDKIKAEDPNRYWSKDTQVAMHKDAMALGEKFFVTQ